MFFLNVPIRGMKDSSLLSVGQGFSTHHEIPLAQRTTRKYAAILPRRGGCIRSTAAPKLSTRLVAPLYSFVSFTHFPPRLWTNQVQTKRVHHGGRHHHWQPRRKAGRCGFRAIRRATNIQGIGVDWLRLSRDGT